MPALPRFDEQYGDQVPVIGIDFLDTQPEAAIELVERAASPTPARRPAGGAPGRATPRLTGLPRSCSSTSDGAVAYRARRRYRRASHELVDLVDDHLGVAA